MSRIQQNLQILLSVKDEGIENLNKAQRGMKEVAQSTARLAAETGDLGGAVRTLDTLYDKFNETIQDAARRQVELNKIERDRQAIINRIATTERETVRSRADLLAQTGRYAQAERELQRLLRTGIATGADRVAIERQIVRVRDQAARSAERAAAAERRAEQERSRSARETVQFQARLARETGDTAREVQILTQATSRLNLETRDQRALLLDQARAQARLRREQERATEAIRRQRREANLLRQTFRGLQTGFNIFTRALASFVLIGFTARSIFRAINTFILNPLKEVTQEILTVTDEFRQLESSLVGVVGSLSAVKSLTQDIGQAAQGLPVTQLEAIGAIRGLAFTPGTASILQQPTGTGRQDDLNRILRIVTGLATIDPEQGTRGARFSVREALAGEFRSLRFRFEVSPDAIAATIGRSLEDLKADPRLTVEALETFVNTFVGDEAFNAFQNLLSTQGNLFRGELEKFANQIGDAGLFDKVVGIVRGINEALASAGAAGDLDRAATLISDSLSRVVDVIIESANQILTGLAGSAIDLRELDVAKLASVAAGVIGTLSLVARDLIDNLPTLAAAIQGLARIAGVDIGPVTEAGIRSSIAQQFAPRRAVSTGVGGVSLVPAFQSATDEQIQALLNASPGNEALRELATRLDIVLGRGPSSRGRNVASPDDPFREATAALLTVERGGAAQAFQAISGANTLQGRIDAFAAALDSAFGEAPTALPALLQKATDTLEKANDIDLAADRLAGRLGLGGVAGVSPDAVSDLRSASAAATLGLQNLSGREFRSLINSSLGFTRQLPSNARQQDTIGLLSAISGLGGVDFRAGTGLSTRPGQLEQTLLRAIATAGGSVDTSTFVTPELLPTIIQLIDDLGDTLQRTGSTGEEAAEAVFNAINTFRVQFADSPIALDFLNDLEIQWKETVEEIRAAALDEELKRQQEELKRTEEVFKQTAEGIRDETNALKESFRDLQEDLRQFDVGTIFEGLPSSGPGLSAGQSRAGFASAVAALATGFPRLINSLDDAILEYSERINDVNDRIVEQFGIGNDLAVEELERQSEELVDQVDKLLFQKGDELRKANLAVQAAFRGQVAGLPGQVGGLGPRGAGSVIDAFFTDTIGGLGGRNAALTRAGLNPIGLEPGDVAALSSTIQQFATILDDARVSSDDTREAIGGLADRFRDVIVAARDAASDPAVVEAFDNALEAFDLNTQRLKDQYDLIIELSSQFATTVSQTIGSALGESLTDAMFEAGQNITDIFKNTFKQVVALVNQLVVEILFVRLILNPILNSILPGSNLPVTGGNGILSLFGAAATGMVGAGGRQIPFQSGGIFSQPTFFGMRDNRGSGVGVLGEGGSTEGILPLGENAEGQLGVMDFGGGGRNVVVNQYVTIQATDADSFRRSRRQISEQLRDAVKPAG